MKTRILVAVLLAAGVTTSALAADTASVAVSASVTGTCKFTAGGTVSFTLDPSSGTDATGTVSQPTFWCTKGAAYTISDDFGVNEAVAGSAPRRMKHASLAEYIPYTFTYTGTGNGNGKGSPITMNIASTVVNANFINASAGSYDDTVTLTIAP